MTQVDEFNEFKDCRILVVEDSFLIARSLSDMLVKLGCEVVGPASTVAQAQELLDETQPHAAILDIALDQETSCPIARRLADRQCPFTFLTGYDGARVLPDDLRDRPCLQKPVDPDVLRSMLHDLLESECQR